MLNLEFNEDVDSIIDSIFTQTSKEAIVLKKILKKALLKNTQIHVDPLKDEEINTLSQKLADLEAECDDIMQQLASLRNRTYEDLKKRYDDYITKLDIENKLKLPNIPSEAIKLREIEINNDLSAMIEDLTNMIEFESTEHKMADILIEEYLNKKQVNEYSALELAAEYFDAF